MRIVPALLLVLAATGVQAQPISPIPPSKPAPCPPPQPSWKMSKETTTFDDVDKKLAGKPGWEEYKKGRRTHDLIREFSDARTRGYAVFRGACLQAFFVTASR